MPAAAAAPLGRLRRWRTASEPRCRSRNPSAKPALSVAEAELAVQAGRDDALWKEQDCETLNSARGITALDRCDVSAYLGAVVVSEV